MRKKKVVLFLAVALPVLALAAFGGERLGKWARIPQILQSKSKACVNGICLQNGITGGPTLATAQYLGDINPKGTGWWSSPCWQQGQALTYYEISTDDGGAGTCTWQVSSLIAGCQVDILNSGGTAISGGTVGADRKSSGTFTSDANATYYVQLTAPNTSVCGWLFFEIN